jgi:hypothetical protein
MHPTLLCVPAVALSIALSELPALRCALGEIQE